MAPHLHLVFYRFAWTRSAQSHSLPTDCNLSAEFVKVRGTLWVIYHLVCLRHSKKLAGSLLAHLSICSQCACSSSSPTVIELLHQDGHSSELSPEATRLTMRTFLPLIAAMLAPMAGLAAPTGEITPILLAKGDNLCSQYKSPPQLCTPDPTITVEQTAQRAYKFYKAFVVDGDARTMFSLIDNSYIVST